MNIEFKVRLEAFGGNERHAERIVAVPSAELRRTTTVESILDLIWHYGQNDFQPLPRRSVSVGDVIELHSEAHYRVAPVGFEKVEAAS